MERNRNMWRKIWRVKKRGWKNRKGRRQKERNEE